RNDARTARTSGERKRDEAIPVLQAASCEGGSGLHHRSLPRAGADRRSGANAGPDAQLYYPNVERSYRVYADRLSAPSADSSRPRADRRRSEINSRSIGLFGL